MKKSTLLKTLAVTWAVLLWGEKIANATDADIFEAFKNRNNKEISIWEQWQKTSTALVQNFEWDGWPNPKLNDDINSLDQDPFDWVKWFVNQSDKTEVDHYNLLLKTAMSKDESHILWLKAALLALHNDPEVKDEDKKILALLLLEDCVALPTWTPNRILYLNRYQSKLEEEALYDKYIEYIWIPGDITAYIARQELNKTLEKWKQLDKDIKQLEEQNKLLRDILVAYQNK